MIVRHPNTVLTKSDKVHAAKCSLTKKGLLALPEGRENDTMEDSTILILMDQRSV